MDVHSVHDLLILLHAASAVASFLAGCLLVFSARSTSNPRVFGPYWWSLMASVMLLAGALIVYWLEYSPAERIIFPGLLALAIYMFYRATSARRLLSAQQAGWRHDYIEHIGFTLISFFEGFVIVSGLNAGLPGWLVAILAVLGLLAGRVAIRSARRRAA